ncbi:hypothetical protein SARC_00983 [Sphaeroforma arctica JP610]|uniref:Cytochrome b5 heme-binding domain-containing protein n=1 Tax=Sphaeroforma arctica JP610 TaxID=667725 RepID=A0A0L0GF01_9EUKA|nr:hypothetical protein SARC_00983 [Sphaeroforma arctica JP610]KNC86888.1 hypothetical protein SARC_00983 [Sphaeroforma arctica JP610]|eukprot:XP_014160790.1 hypothetical protein SARC_00983 [Sphaeroforma arctica JP610]
MPPHSRTKVVSDSDPELSDLKMKHFTREEILNHTNDKYCILEDGVYDLTNFRDKHPGGDVLDFFPGQDATPHFYMLHQYESLPSVLAEYKVGSVARDDSYVYHTPLMKQIKSAVRKVMPMQEWWAPPSWYIKACAILAATLYTDYLWIASGPTIPLAIVSGLLYAAIGLNIQHDANHGSVSRNPMVNRLFGYSQDWIGGSRMLWIRQHVVGHHTHCNRHQHDPDVKGGSVITLSRYSLPKEFHHIQQYYFLPLIQLLGFQWVFLGLHDLIEMKYKGEKLPESYRKERNIAIGLRVFFSSVNSLYRLPCISRGTRSSAPTCGWPLLLCTWASSSFCRTSSWGLSRCRRMPRTLIGLGIKSSRPRTSAERSLASPTAA